MNDLKECKPSVSCIACLNTLLNPNSATEKGMEKGEWRSEFAEVVGFEASEDDRLCYICMHLVRKFFKFRRKCLKLHDQLTVSKVFWCEPLSYLTKSLILEINTDEIDEESNILKSAILLEKSMGFWSRKSEIKVESIKIEEDDDIFEEDGEFNGYEDKEQRSKRNRSAITSEAEDDALLKLNMVAILFTDEEQRRELEDRKKTDAYLNAPYKCERCASHFSYKDSYDSHRIRHSELHGAHECAICGVRFPSVRTLWSHRSNHRRRYECIVCGRRVQQRRDCTTHRATCPLQAPPIEMENQLTCDLCGKQSSNEYALKRHRKRAHFAKKKHQCHLCEQMFMNVQALRDHLVIHSGQKPYVCDKCESAFPTKSRLQQHSVTHIASRNFYCATCDISFPTGQRLKSHLSVGAKHISNDKLRHECLDCHRRFYTARSLQLHVDRMHLKVRRYACADCPLAYSAPNALVLHLRKAHPEKAPRRKRKTLLNDVAGNKKYICDFCGADFKSITILRCHVRRHTGERPLQCTYCEAKFAYPSARYTHIRLVHLKLKRSKKNK